MKKPKGFEALNKIATATNTKARASVVRRKRTSEQSTEAILSLQSVLPSSLATMDGGECPGYPFNVRP